MKQKVVYITSLICTAFIAAMLTMTSTVMMSYDMVSDGGASDHVLSQSRWNAAVASIQAAGGGEIHIPGPNWTITAVNLGVPGNVTVSGDGCNITTLRFSQSLTTSLSDNGFIAIGVSNVTFKNLRILSGSKRLNAVFKFNSMGANATTECKNIVFDGVWIDSSYANGIKMGETAGLANGESHHVLNLTVKNCEISHLGDPNNQYTTADNANQNTICTGVVGNQTTWAMAFIMDYIHDCSGDGINNNLTGWNNSAGMVTNPLIGIYTFDNVRIENTYSNLVLFGNWGRGIRITNCTFLNPTGNGGFCISIEGIGITTSGNIFSTWQGRNAEEVYGANIKLGKSDVVTLYLADHPIVATRRSDSRPTTQMMLTGGYENEYLQTMRYDTTLGVSSNIPARRAGIHISNQAQAGYQPLTWDGRNYAFGFHFGGQIYNTTGPAIYAENIPVAEVYLDYPLYIQSSTQTENVIKYFNTYSAPGWFANGVTFNLKGSPAPTKTNGLPNYGLMGPNKDNGKQGNANAHSAVYSFKFIGSNTWTTIPANGFITKTGNQVSDASYSSSN